MEVYDDPAVTASDFIDRGLFIPRSELEERITASMRVPQAFTFSDRSGLGFILFRGDVFQEGYFRRARVMAAPGGARPSTAELAQRQPWLEWDVSAREFRARTTGAQERILSGLPERVTLYRGGDAEEADLIAAATKLRRRARAGDPSRVAVLARKYLGLSRGDRDAVFTSIAEETGRRWARPALLSSEVSRRALLELSRRGSLFVGFEYEHMEVAFTLGEAVDAFFRGACVVEAIAERPPEGLQVDVPDAPDDPDAG